jgi:hypothetical protein
VVKVPTKDFLFSIDISQGIYYKELGKVIIKRVLENAMVAPFSWMDSEMMDFF